MIRHPLFVCLAFKRDTVGTNRSFVRFRTNETAVFWDTLQLFGTMSATSGRLFLT